MDILYWLWNEAQVLVMLFTTNKDKINSWFEKYFYSLKVIDLSNKMPRIELQKSMPH